MTWKRFFAATLSILGVALFNRRRNSRNAAYAEDQPHDNYTDIRDAGPEAMRDPCIREWSETDEDLDESFPASDPPGGY
jgi:hypothetical protein